MNRAALKSDKATIAPAETISTDELTEITGHPGRYLRDLAKAGYIPSPEHGRWQERKCLVGILRYRGELLSKKNSNKAAYEEAIKKTKMERDAEELALWRGELVAKAEIGPKLRNIALHQKAVLQHKLEREIPPKLIGRTPEEQLALLREAVDAVLKIYSEGVQQWTEEKMA